MSTSPSPKKKTSFNVEIGDRGSDNKQIFDLNEIFHIDLSYNFDLLKNLLSTIIKNQKLKDDKILDLENQLLDLRISLNEENSKNLDKSKESKNKQTPKKEIKENIDISTPEIILHQLKPPTKEIILEESNENPEIVNKIIQNIKGINEYMNETYKVIPDLQKSLQIENQKRKSLEDIISQLKDKIGKLEKKNSEFDKKIKEINSKTQDINMADILKSNISDMENEEGKNLAIKLITQMENNINGKLKITEGRLNKLEESNFKTTKEIQNIKNAQDLNKRNISLLKQNNENMIINIKDLNKRNISLLKQNHENMIIKIKNIENKINKIGPQIEQKIETETKIIKKEKKEKEEIEESSPKKEEKEKRDSFGSFSKKSETPILDLENNEKIKEIISRISDLEKNVKILPNQMGIEQIKLDISTLKSAIRNCALVNDLKESKEKEEDIQKQLNFIKEQFEDYISNNADHEDLQNIKRKMELLNSKVHELEENYQLLGNKLNVNNKNKTNITSYDKYLETQIFDNFKSQIIKEFSSVNDNFTHLRRLIDNILESLKNKPSYRDIKALEEELNLKYEELKVASSKKFAERIETTKNFKYLDTQIKNILQIYIKKEKRSENWLLAKKPITNLCASCEAYIGELKDNNSYQPWNKYPLKDPNDKIYRLGNGFSKMLQMVQLDENDKKNIGMITQQNNNEFIIGNKLLKLDKIDSNFNNEINIGHIKTEINNNNKNLPKIKGNNTATNFSKKNINENNNNKNKQGNNLMKENENIDLIDKNDIISDEDEENKPKIMKITKINKE